MDDSDAMGGFPAIEYELWQNGEPTAWADRFEDIAHYALVYGQDGPVFIVEVRREVLGANTPLVKADT